jgi:hypothetical protein
MYTGTLINDLMAAVERVEHSVQEKLLFNRNNEKYNSADRNQIFDLQTYQASEPSLAGAA